MILLRLYLSAFAAVIVAAAVGCLLPEARGVCGAVIAVCVATAGPVALWDEALNREDNSE